MGLCKCPKRKVTNLFCFEHRVNVCEWCLVASHESCVVQTYLSWLTDSDFDPNCTLCSEPLPTKETVRLKCLHLFHWDCLNAREEQLPPNTAPAGYKCPSCLECIFPAERQTSPIVDHLKEKLRGASWARSTGVDGVEISVGGGDGGYDVGQPAHNAAENHHHHQRQQPAVDPFQVVNTFTARASKGNNDSNNHHHHHSNSSQYAYNYYNGPSTVVSSGASLPLLQAMNGGGDADGLMDESKYAKRGGERNGLKHGWARLPRSVKRLVLGIAACLLIYLLLTTLFGSGGQETANKSAGRSGAAEDVLFDPHANPNIRIGEANKGEAERNRQWD